LNVTSTSNRRRSFTTHSPTWGKNWSARQVIKRATRGFAMISQTCNASGNKLQRQVDRAFGSGLLRSRSQISTLEFAASRVFFPMNTVFMLFQAKTAGLPLSLLLRNLPSPMLPARPPFTGALKTHTVTPLSGTHGTSLSAFRSTPARELQ
jgi:hypothetical protein